MASATLLLVAGVVSYCWLSPSAIVARTPRAQLTDSSPARPPGEPTAAGLAPRDSASDSPRFRAAGSVAGNARGLLPHPITPQHERIFRENALLGELNGALDVRDVAGLRRLLASYRDEYPEDAHVLQDGYELIANCWERPGAATRAAAQRYYDERLDSGLRRYIRRHCLEASP